MINKYQHAAQDYIIQQKQLELTAYQNNEGNPVKWDDYMWIAVDPTTKQSYNIFFLNPVEVKMPYPTNVYSGKQLLSGFSDDLSKCYSIDLIEKQGITKDIARKQLGAREILTWVDGEIWHLTQEKLDTKMKGVANFKLPLYRPFIEYCQQKGFLAKTVRFNYKAKQRDSSAEAALKKQYEKMPDEQLILATASVFHTIVPQENETIDIFDNVRDRFVSCMTAFAMASPNRMVAEQLMIIKQDIKRRQVELPKKVNNTLILDEDGNQVLEKNIIHWLDWQGSKGYKDNRNHILACMAPNVERALNYLNVVCEPARVLCRYYAKPDAELKFILGQFQPKNLHGLSLNKPVNLFQLGGLLGFYNNVDTSNLKLNGFPFTADIHHQFFWGARNANTLLGTGTLLNRKWLPFKQEQQMMTLAELEQLWLAHIKTSLPGFPYRYEGDSGSKVKMEHALCIFTGAQLLKVKTGKAQYASASSCFAIDSSDMGSLISKTLGKNGIFQRNGFADSFTIRPHQYRHYLNTKCQDSEMPELVIAMFSGRVKVESNADYDNTPDSEKVAQIAHINAPDMEKSIKVHTQEEYEKATGKVAHKMSTGICTQQLHQSPCTFLNDFLTQCIGCRSSCHLNRDVEAIELLEQDLAIQKYRLDEVKNNPSIKTNPIRQEWFMNHHRGVFVLEELIELMKSNDIKRGSLIRYAGDESAFQLIDIEKREQVERKIALPDSQEALDTLLLGLKDEYKPTGDEGINNLLANLGVAI